MPQHLLAVLSLCVICASASTPLEMWKSGLSEGNHYAQVAKDTVESALNIRRSSLTDQCSLINDLTAGQLNSMAATLDAPASCITPMFDFFKNTLCSDVCINSPLLANMSSSRRAGGRQLLGGGPPSDPETACEDACFSPLMTGMITVMKAMLLPECTTAFSSRRLLGGSNPDEDSMAALELAFGMMCSKNAAGSYCVTIEEGISNTNENTTGFLSGSTCLASTSLQNSVSSLGCCWGNMVTLSGIANDTDDFMEKVSKQAAACNIALSTTPCASGMSVATVESTVSMAGITLAQFRTTANEAAFKKGVATTAGVSKNLVAITESTATARRSGVQVKSTVTLAGDAANSKSTVQSNLQNTATLQSNIQSADPSSNLASATVGASTAVSGSTVTGTANSGSSAGTTSSDTASSDTDDTTSLIVGLVVMVVIIAGIVGGIILGCFCCKCCCWSEGKAAHFQQPLPTSVVQQPLQMAQPIQVAQPAPVHQPPGYNIQMAQPIQVPGQQPTQMKQEPL